MQARETTASPTRLEGKALDEAIASRPFEKVTKDGIEQRIKDVSYMTLGATVTICNIELVNGYSVRGESACVDPGNFNLEIGQSLAYKDAFSKLWALEGYLLAERRYAASHVQPQAAPA